MIRLERIVMLQELRRDGLSISAVARRTGMDRKTVRKLLDRGLAASAYSSRKPRARRLEPYEGTCRAEMDWLLKREGRDGQYRLCKITVEQGFGQIKQARRFRRFLLRSLGNVQRKWPLGCIVHNLNKLVSAWLAAQPAKA